MKTVIRQALKNEFKIIQKLNHELFLSDYQYNKLLNLNWPYEKEGIAYLKSRVEGKKGICLVAEIDGKVVAYLIGGIYGFESWKPVKRTELESIVVTKDYRNQGIGQRLFEEFTRWSKQQGISRVKVGTGAKNEKAIRFYQKLGFEPDQMYLETELK